jgi:hypothetical protein
VELTVDWPSRHDDVTPVELVMTGFILRSSDRGRISVRITSHRFRVESEPAVAMGAIA